MTAVGAAGSLQGSGPDFCKNPAALEAGLLGAHAAGDFGALAALYGVAADLAEAAGEVDRACFFLTQAYVLALEQGSPQAAAFCARLRAHGREH